jgi:mannose-6-phosphate isomerase-like protein (cupin superfamily)
MKIIEKLAHSESRYGVQIFRYDFSSLNLPFDFVFAKFKKAYFPWKKNHGFYELFYVIEGDIEIIFEDDIEFVWARDIYIIKPEVKHSIKSDAAKAILCCSPRFIPENVEFLAKEEIEWGER